MNIPTNIKLILSYYLEANTVYRLHSPKLYQIVSQCIEDNRNYYHFGTITMYYHQMLADTTTITLTDYGAGSNKGVAKSIADIAKSAVSPPQKAQQLFKIAHYAGAKNILELGTSLGISAAYYSYCPSANVTTLEGDPAISAYAKNLFNTLRRSNIDLVVGSFEDTLREVLRQKQPFDFVYLDGNHRKEATIAYYEQILPHLSDQATIIVDDIYWSEGMQSAWQILTQAKDVTHSLNVGHYGILLINKKNASHKTAFDYIPWRYKPWQIGLLK